MTHVTHPKMVTHLTHDPLTHFHLCCVYIRGATGVYPYIYFLKIRASKLFELWSNNYVGTVTELIPQ